jgi:hypothetical protein
VPSVTTCLTCDLRLHDLVNLLVRRFQLFHEKIHLGCQHIYTINLVYSFSTGWLPISLPTLVGGNLVNERLSSCNIESEECTSCCCVYVVLRPLAQATEEVLNDQPFFHSVVWACCNVILEMFPGFWVCLILVLLKTGNPVSKGVGFAHRKVLGQECIRTGITCGECIFVGVEPCLCFPMQRESE